MRFWFGVMLPIKTTNEIYTPAILLELHVCINYFNHQSLSKCPVVSYIFVLFFFYIIIIILFFYYYYILFFFLGRWLLHYYSTTLRIILLIIRSIWHTSIIFLINMMYIVDNYNWFKIKKNTYNKKKEKIIINKNYYFNYTDLKNPFIFLYI